jgi:frataxin-like iron-binding protein CyaY
MAIKRKDAESTASKTALTDKIYLLLSDETPLIYFLNSRHTQQNDLQYFDEETNSLRSLRYCTNQRSVFEDEQTGNAVLGTIPFEDGKLIVPKTNPTLQLFLSLTPANGVKFKEFNPEKVAEEQIEELDYEFNAQREARELSIEKMEDVALSIPTIGNRALKMNSKELKRDVLLYAKAEPKSFLKLLNNEDLVLRGTVVWALENNLLTFKNHKFFNGEDLILEVPYDEVDANMTIVRYFKTKEGASLLKYIDSQRN